MLFSIKEAMILDDLVEKPLLEIGFDITSTHLTNWFFKLVIKSCDQAANPSSLLELIKTIITFGLKEIILLFLETMNRNQYSNSL